MKNSEGLNEKQSKAVTLPNKHALIIAGAGTGKTKTLVARVLFLLKEEKVKAEEILALTFTNKAAQEMKERIGSFLTQEILVSLWVGTFHGVAYKLIRQDFEGFGYKKHAVIIDGEEQKALLKRLYKDLGWGEAMVSIKDALKVISEQKEKGVQSHNFNPSSSEQKYVEVFVEYEKRMKEENLLDFSDLLLAIRNRLRDDPVYFKKMSGKWKTILVDEFQDTNPLQYEILELLVLKGGSIFAVGDDDQSIYSFRGAEVENIFSFAKNFAKENVIKLEENYRSTSNILNAANKVIGMNENRLGKELWTSAGQGRRIKIEKVTSEQHEARHIAEDIQEWGRANVKFNDMAILYRSNAQSRLMEQELLKNRIPYKIIGGLRFYARAEVKDAVSHLRVLTNPNDISAFHRAISKPTMGVGDKRIGLWKEIAKSERLPFFEAIKYSAETKKDKYAFKVIQMIDLGQSLLKSKGLGYGFAEYLTEINIKSVYDKDEKKNDRFENIDELVNALFEFENTKLGQEGDVSDFLANASLDSKEEGSVEGVHMSTIHASKGLEFSAVCLMGFEEGILPNSRALEEPLGSEEECRLAYVAMTRAKKYLSIFFTGVRYMYGEKTETIPSRYLSVISPDFISTVGTDWPPHPRPFQWDQVSHQRKSSMALVNETATKRSDAPIAGEPMKQNSQPCENWEVGNKVRHPNFGFGVIIWMKVTTILELKIKFKEGIKTLIVLKNTKLFKVTE